MKNYLHLLICFLMFQNVIGAPNRGKDFDLQGYIDAEIAAGKSKIVVPPGVYRVAPKQRHHLRFKNLRNITIMAENVEMICTETTRAMTFENCTNVTLSGLTIDYDPLCFTQGRITLLSPDKSILEFKLDDNYPDNLVQRIEIFDSKTNNLKRSTYYGGWTKFEKIADRTYRVTKGAKYKYNPDVDKEEVGDILVTNNEYTPNGNAAHAICSDKCVNLKLEKITLYSGNCFGFFETNGTKNSYLNCKIDRRPVETDMYLRSKRMRSNDADGYHSKFAYVGPQIINCLAQYNGDDGVNICGKYYMSLGAEGNTILLDVSGDCDISTGAFLEVVTMDGQRISDLKVLDIEEEDGVLQSHIDSISKMKFNDGTKKNLMKPENKTIKLTVDKEVKFKLGTVVADKNRMGSGFLVKNSNFSFNRSRGILIKASKGQVIKNTMEGNWMSAILISPEVWWLESGCSDSLEVIANKIVDNGGKYAIRITGEGFKGGVPAAGFHKNINVTNNQLTNCYLPAIYIASTKNGSVLMNNIITPRPSKDPNDKPSPIITLKCEDLKTDF